jgi:hypothetical protein
MYGDKPSLIPSVYAMVYGSTLPFTGKHMSALTLLF